MSSGPPPMPQQYAQPISYRTPQPSDGGVSQIVPYRNPMALAAYYMGVFSVIPVIGVILAIPAVIFGVKGLKFAKLNPQAQGKAHAWIGVIGGGVFGLLWLGLIATMAIVLLMNALR